MINTSNIEYAMNVSKIINICYFFSLFLPKKNMSDYSEDITISKPIIEMVTVANEFCHFMDTCEEKSKNGILEFVNRITPLLYLKGSLLPGITVEDPDANEKYVTAENWEVIFNLLRKKFEKDDEYWIIDPQYINETEPLKASLSENLADIYQDMKDFILLFQKNTYSARQNAINECKILFSTHWGYRVVNIMAKVHHMLHENDEEDTSSSGSTDLF